MAGYDPAKAARMNQLAQQYPNASLSTLATLARVSVSDLGNYTNDSVGTRASNANFGRVTSESSQGVQSTTTPRNSAGSGSAFAGNDIPPTTVTSISSTPRINPFTGRAFETPTTPAVTSPPSSQNNTNSSGSAGSQFAFSDTPTPVVSSPTSSQTATNTTGSGTSFQGGGTITGQAFGNGGRDPAPAPDPFPAPPPARPVQAQDSDVDFTDAYGENYRQATPIPTPVVQPQDDDVDFDGGYGGSFREVTPIPPSTRQPGVEQATLPPGSRGSGEFLDDRGRAPAEQPDPFPAAPPARPAQEISQVDDFGGTGITEVDDFGGPSRNITPVDDFSGSAVPPQVDDFGAPSRNVTPVDDFAEYQAPAQVDDFAEINTPAQVDDFGGYSNNDFGTEDPGLDAFGPGPAPAQVDDFAEYQSPAQVDDFAEFQAPAQVDDFADYSDNNFGTEDPGLDAFGPGPAPAQVDDFAGYTNNDFGAQVDDFGEINTPAQVDDFGDYSNNDFGAQVDDFGEINAPAQVDDFAGYSNNDFGAEEDFSDFATTDSPEEVNPFGVDDFGGPEAAQFDAFGNPILAAEEVVESDEPIVAEFDAFGNPIDPQVTTAEFDAFGNPIDAEGNRTDLVENDGESLVGDDPTGELDDLDGFGSRVGQAELSQQQEAALQAQALKAKAQQQQTVSEMREASGVKNADGDWRVKLRLAPQATYLYQAPDPGILAPLTETDGIIFPYTPTIDIQYRAEYQAYSPTHSNYQHYFYKSSNVGQISLNADFTAQDTVEAEYLLAVIHFLKSASKMFYGQDAQRGSPPPLLYLTGLGEYQFNESPCVISEFNYNLPPDVNYIRARSKQIQRDGQLQYQKPLATSVTNGNFSSLSRLKTAATNAINGQSDPIQAGAEPTKLAPGTLGAKGATYVPTKMSIALMLNPIVSRQQVSQQFSLKDYANGNLIKKGMW